MSQKINENVTVKEEKGKVIIEITPSQGVISKSGKTLVVASTNGFVKVGEFSLNLNLTKAR